MTPAPASALAWLALSALDGSASDPVLPALAETRAAAEGLRRFPEADGETEAWSAFAEPFQAAMETVRALTGPVLGLSEGVAPEASGPSSFPASPSHRDARETPLAAAPAAATDPAMAPRGSSVETGNPSLLEIAARIGSLSGASVPQAGTRPAVAGAQPKADPRPSRQSAPPASIPGATAALVSWTDRLTKAVAAVLPPIVTPQSPARPAVPMPAPGDPVAQAFFLGLLERIASAPGPDGSIQEAPGGASPGVTPVSPPSGRAPGPDPLADLQNLLAGMPLIGAPGNPASPAAAPGAPAPFTGNGGAQAPVSMPSDPTSPSPRGPLSAVPQSPDLSARARSSEVEWLDEEDDLAARLNRLLRRQARRHGVDLS